MRKLRNAFLLIACLGMIGFAPALADAADGLYVLPFIATQNAPGGVDGGAEGVMRIQVEDGKSRIHLRVRGLYPNTVYTIWTVFNKLTWNPANPGTGHSIPSCPANGENAAAACGTSWQGWNGFPSEGNGVAPTAKMSARFTDGMGLDPGATFKTNPQGDGQVSVQLDYDITAADSVTGPPLGNKNIIRQTVPVPTCDTDANGNLTTTCSKKSLRITTTYLRGFVAEHPVADRATKCANYDAKSDPENVVAYDHEHANGSDARLWQCVHPVTGLPRVPRYGFDHFRLANHPDELTHGFIGGNGIDHWIDMVGRRGDLTPSVDALIPK